MDYQADNKNARIRDGSLKEIIKAPATKSNLINREWRWCCHILAAQKNDRTVNLFSDHFWYCQIQNWLFDQVALAVTAHLFKVQLGTLVNNNKTINSKESNIRKSQVCNISQTNKHKMINMSLG